MGRARVLYVHGNHDQTYDRRPPEGCDCIEDKLVTVGGLRILGLGGTPVYSGGAFLVGYQQDLHSIGPSFSGGIWSR